VRKLFEGLKMIHLKSFITALKATWIRVYKEEGNWALILEIYFDKETLANCGLEKLKEESKRCSNLFWKDVLEAWYNTIISSNIYNTNIRENPLWFNSEIKIDRKFTLKNSWFKKGVQFVYNALNRMDHSTSLKNFKKNIT